jgi:hypothetical protein
MPSLVCSYRKSVNNILPASETVQVSHALPAVCFSCLLWGRGTGFQDGVAVGEGFLCAPV